MGKLADRLAADIAAQQAEIERVKTTARTELANAQQRLAVLQQAQTAVTPELEALIDALAKVGVNVRID